MSIARTVTILKTDFKDFTFGTYNFCWPILEYGVAIVVSCAPLLRPLAEKFTFSPFSSRQTGTERSGRDANSKMSGNSGFAQLSESDMPLQPLAAPTSVTSVIGNARSSGDHTTERDLAMLPRESNLPQQFITVERSWDVGPSRV